MSVSTNHAPSGRVRFPWMNRCLWLYLAVAVLLAAVVDRDQAYLNRMNTMKDVESPLEIFLKKGGPLDANTLKWAVRYYRGLLRYAPDNSLVHGDLGFCYFYLGRTDEAIRAYEKAIALEPELYTYYYDLGVITDRRGRETRAADYYLAALNRVKNSVQYFIKSTEVLRASMHKDFSGLAMSLLKRSQVDEEVMLLRLVDIHMDSQDYAQALVLAEEGLKTHPGSWRLNYKAGRAAAMMGAAGPAVDYLSRAVDLEPRAVRAVTERGLILKKIGREDAANADFMKARRMGGPGPDDGPGDMKLHLNIGLRILRQSFW